MKAWFKGWFGEKETALRIWFSLDRNTYQRFHNIILPSNNGTTQIDHLIISIYGIFIIETKNRQGWIYGLPDQPNWTQVLYQQNFTFQNPIRQTFRQKKVLMELLQLREYEIKTVIYFVGDCEFKTAMPENVLQSGLTYYIKNFRERVFDQSEVDEMVDLISYYISDFNLDSSDHINSLNVRHNSTTTCPKCGSDLVIRLAKKGKFANTEFLGCSNYPKCKFSRDI